MKNNEFIPAYDTIEHTKDCHVAKMHIQTITAKESVESDCGGRYTGNFIALEESPTKLRRSRGSRKELSDTHMGSNYSDTPGCCGTTK